ncbi:Z1 domain-containing protein [Flavobacteriales bacterium]|nr:Z1 domain-containing protein [Flavobacteriales bacterium]
MKTFIRKFKVLKNKGSNKVILGESIEKLFSGLDLLSLKEKQNLEESSKKIIENCVPAVYPKSNKESNTGIVIGKIQSGKTLSFTSVIALARDNGYKLVVVISGRSNLLLKQTKDRLREDMLDDKKIQILNLKLDFNRKLKQLSKPFIKPQRGKLTIITILKHQDRLKDVKELFESKELSGFLKKNSVLIIDDEADQASLNTFARANAKENAKITDGASAIFSGIKLLRNSCPNHTYLQYTATPQANLLIDSLSLLSPDWHVLLTPGEDYTGGNSFFSDNKYKIQLNSPIPKIGEYPPVTKDLIEPPQSYIDSIAEFFILSALMSGQIKNTIVYNKNATMLVHPTFYVNETKSSTVGIKRFVDWCINIIDAFEISIGQGDYDSFKEPYKILKKEMEGKGLFKKFPSLNEVMEVIDEQIIDEVTIAQVTGGMLDKEEGYDWDATPYHILLGGALLDRGFTVKELIMTYMPRDNKSSNQADTIEQRCRFYGYRKKYLPFCRVYLNEPLIKDFKKYNEFEDFLHNYLSKHTLKEFYEQGSRLLMDKGLIPTNMARISDSLINTHLTKWQHFEPQGLFTVDNNSLLEGYIKRLNSSFEDLIPKDKVHRKNHEAHLHKAVLRPIQDFLDVLLDFKTPYLQDEIKKEAIISYMELLMEHEGVKNVWIVEIAPDGTRERTINKTKSKKGKNEYKMSSLMAGDAVFEKGVPGGTYFGDRSLIKGTKTTSSIPFDYKDEPIIQIHRIKAGLQTQDEVPFKGENFYTLAMYFPEKYKRNFIQKLKKS